MEVCEGEQIHETPNAASVDEELCVAPVEQEGAEKLQQPVALQVVLAVGEHVHDKLCVVEVANLLAALLVHHSHCLQAHGLHPGGGGGGGGRGREVEREVERERVCVCVCERDCVCVCVRQTGRVREGGGGKERGKKQPPTFPLPPNTHTQMKRTLALW